MEKYSPFESQYVYGFPLSSLILIAFLDILYLNAIGINGFFSHFRTKWLCFQDKLKRNKKKLWRKCWSLFSHGMNSIGQYCFLVPWVRLLLRTKNFGGHVLFFIKLSFAIQMNSVPGFRESGEWIWITRWTLHVIALKSKGLHS